MRFPLDAVLKRGAVFLWREYSRLDDPTVASKNKYLVLLNAFLPDDPIFYILTTSQVQNKPNPFQRDLVHFPARSYAFFPVDTTVNVANAGELTIEADKFEALYQDTTIDWVGSLSPEDMARIDEAIKQSLRVERSVKRKITAW